MRCLTLLSFLLLIPPPAWGQDQAGQPPVTDSETVADAETAETATQQPAALAPELSAVQAQSQAFVAAFNQHDAEAVAALWTENAEYISHLGTAVQGREAIEQAYAQFFADHPETKIQVVIDSLRQVGEGLVIEDGRALVSPPPGGAAGISKYTAVHTQDDGQWRMASVRDVWVDAAATRESTDDLEFLIGDWVAEEHGIQLHSVCRWVAGGHFVARTYTTTQVDGSQSSGLQLIGWNPVDNRIQSWMFSPDGGHAMGVWSITATGWIAETRGATGDGTPTTSLNRLSRLDENAYVWQSIQRTVGGVAVPDTDEVVIKRKPTEK
ncbi:SnoaL-like domain protein [Allorhodopirellula solitaria]|uniref:SnoaL-like domain protein n=2 Tax=Allorhodopirellula solitaria TaxID=2527987 RepID=A0A5C5XX15_9BACT|nr:SnoaL-like domain protein [Allorhodopirellula solitaria]